MPPRPEVQYDDVLRLLQDRYPAGNVKTVLVRTMMNRKIIKVTFKDGGTADLTLYADGKVA